MTTLRILASLFPSIKALPVKFTRGARGILASSILEKYSTQNTCKIVEQPRLSLLRLRYSLEFSQNIFRFGKISGWLALLDILGAHDQCWFLFGPMARRDFS